MAITDVRINTLQLRNFKGVREFVADLDGKDSDVYGNNAAGKTTLGDSWHWLSGGKDSELRADFGVKTLDVDGHEIPKLEHEVVGSLTVDGVPLVLSRNLVENWVKHRGAARSEFECNKTIYHVNDVPVGAREFEKRIAGALASAEVLRLLSDPVHFGERLHWEKRREVLLEVCGDVDVAAVVAANPGLAELPSILAGNTPDEHRKVVRARQGKINEELKTALPARIDEARRSLPETAGTRVEVQRVLDARRELRDQAAQQVVAVESGGALADMRVTLTELQGAAKARAADVKDEASEAARAATGALADARQARDVATREATAAGNRYSSAQDKTRRKHDALVQLRADREAEAATEYKPADAPTVCHACEQKLPADRVAETAASAREEWNLNRATRLGKIDKDIELAESEVAFSEGLESAAKDAAAQAGTAAIEAQQATENAHAAAVGSKKAVPDPEQDEQYQSLVAEADAVAERIARMEITNTEEVEAARATLAERDKAVQDGEAQLARVATHEQLCERIEELKERELELARAFEQLERESTLLDEYTKARVDAITERVNEQFEFAQFKLFKTLGHGGTEPMCEVSVNGVPWRDLNHGARVRVGMDVIRTLQRHYGLRVPVFVDQGESVTELPAMECQVIRLVVKAPVWDEDPETGEQFCVYDGELLVEPRG